jgi:Domain of unknown function (DUF4166)/Saccharopine dehydrogenase NADP binding domain
MRVLILGGYGTFGGRLARLLAGRQDLYLILAGRSAAKASAFAAALEPGAGREAVALDRDGELAAAFGRIRPDVVVDASGPFQTYGGDPYKVVRATLAVGAHYLDLADGSGFVDGIGAFNAEALARGRFVLSGVSSFPVLSAAVVRHLTAGWQQIDTVTGGVAPSPYAGVGRNVVRAILSYAGRPVPLRRHGKDAHGVGLVETMRQTIAPPGALPLRSRLFALIDVPDLRLVPKSNPLIRTMWLGAGPVPELLLRGLTVLARLVQMRLLPGLGRLDGIAFWAINTLRWGEHRGGMFVEVSGIDQAGQPAQRSWHLVAEGDNGPFIPAMAVTAILTRMAEGRMPEPGARAATDGLELTDFAPLFAARAIVTGTRDAVPATAPLYRRLLGSAYDRLPAPVRALHDLSGEARYAGRAEIRTGRHPLARLVHKLMGFPEAGDDVPVTVHFSVRDGVETWTRDFAGARFVSTQEAGRGTDAHLLVERFGPLSASMALVVEGDRLKLVVRRWAFFGLPMPLALAPGGEVYETAEDGRFRFNVELRQPLAGLVVRYRGWLEKVG